MFRQTNVIGTTTDDKRNKINVSENKHLIDEEAPTLLTKYLQQPIKLSNQNIIEDFERFAAETRKRYLNSCYFRFMVD